MGSRNRPAGTTRERLLAAAASAFADKGFRDTTVAGICKKARANIAAVNYHFGSKGSLYKEAWRHAHGQALKAFPPDGGVPADAPPAQQLRGRIRAMLQRGLSEPGLEFRIMSHEIANPTGLLAQVVHDTIRPLGEAMENIVRGLIGGDADRETIRLCTVSVLGPCLHVMRRQRMQRRLGHAPWFRADALEGVVEHFTTFVLAGIDGIRRRRALAAAPQETSGAST